MSRIYALGETVSPKLEELTDEFRQLLGVEAVANTPDS